jgi:uncharacterized phage-associated protein
VAIVRCKRDFNTNKFSSIFEGIINMDCNSNSVHQYTPDQIDKIGNTIIYLTEHIQPLYKTKLLKLLYLLDEFLVKKYGVPFLNLDYEVWQAGPVCSDIYQELNEKPNLLEDYISLTFDELGTRVNAKRKFVDSEFSDNEISMLQLVVDKFQYTPAPELVNLTHRESSPWYKAAQANGLLELFKAKKTNTSNCKVDLIDLVKGDALKEQRYKDFQEYYNTVKSLKQ